MAELRAHPACVLAFYTSMRESNALPAVLKITGGEAVEIYDRDYNRADSEGAQDWDTMRDLDRIWQTGGKSGFGFDAASTVMVDDTVRKMRHMPGNLVLVPEFKDAAHAKDLSMPALTAYLLNLLNTFEAATAAASGGGADVRDLLADKPFVFP